MSNWKMDLTHSELGFKTRHMMIATVTGQFRKFDAQLNWTGEDLSDARVKVEVDTQSVDTGNAQRDGHIRAGEFFDSDNHPTMIFESTGLEKRNDQEYVLKGDLKVKDTAKPVSLSLRYGGRWKDPWGSERVGFSIESKINRKDWNLVWNVPLEGGGVLVSEEVKIFGEVQFILSN